MFDSRSYSLDLSRAGGARHLAGISQPERIAGTIGIPIAGLNDESRFSSRLVYLNRDADSQPFDRHPKRNWPERQSRNISKPRRSCRR